MPSIPNSLQEMSSGLLRDLTCALQQMRRKPTFTVVIILTLALGLGSSTAVFSELYATVLKPPPYPNADQLVAVHNSFPQLHMTRLPTSVFDYLDLRKQGDLFSDVGLHYFLDLNHTGTQPPEKVNAVAMTASMFRTLGVNPLIGRVFTPEEERFNGPHALILSESHWQSAFGGDRQILWQSMQLNGEEYRIVGVMPRSFGFPNEVTQMWAPVMFGSKELANRVRPAYYLRMIARLKPGLSFEQGSAQMAEVSRRMSEQRDGSYREQPGWQCWCRAACCCAVSCGYWKRRSGLILTMF